ncbi:Probable LRR receptor-like serine/threonine-protein kinase RKF3 [Linum grandiflorum]
MVKIPQPSFPSPQPQLLLLLLPHPDDLSPSIISTTAAAASMSAVLLFFLLLLLTTSTAQNTSCPLDFTVLQRLYDGTSPPELDPSQNCQYIRQGLRLVQSDYLLRTNNFLPPLSTADSCWRAYQRLVNEALPNFDIRSSCGFQTNWISQGCMNITTRQQFDTLVTNSSLSDVVSSCDQPLENNSPCAACTASLSRLQALHLTGSSVGNVSDCQAYPSIYAAAVVNPLGPNDKGTAKCLFLLDFASRKAVSKKNKKKKFVVVGVSVGLIVAVFIVIGGLWFWRRKYGMMKRKRRKLNRLGIDTNTLGKSTSLENITESTTLVKFKFDEIKKATRSFSRDNIIGKGGYGNVYKGRLMDGSEVAVKRFKNCSAAGDASFAHEVEVIASVRHVNLVALRGYCIATTSMEGHQRIIVCELMKNGSLHDHLLAGSETKLSWPARQKIALGTAKGLAYLHYGAQPGIIHRDIKANNILLDDNFEAKVADFGLAKFNPEGMTHLSTRVAGTMGYVAPEYALYGQLTERSDVYSYGVVLLELLSGKKALFKPDGDEDATQQPSLVTDWAWSLVKEGRGLDVVEDGMPELGDPDVLERYVLVAVLCSHPQLYARPTMDQVVKMLETDLVVPSIPHRSIPLVSEMDDIERSVSSTSGSGQLFSPSGYHSYGFGPSGTKEEEGPESTTS